jgi:ribosomal protein S18 acetylase RimI-like enzyme
MAARPGLTIVMAETADDALQASVARLLPQLSSSSAPPDLDDLRRIIEDPATTLLLAVADGAADGAGDADDDDAGTGAANGAANGDGTRGGTRGGVQVVGMLTLAVFLLPSGVRAWIEDVVVDDEARGAGIASALVQAALDRARQLGARTVDLTSRPEREAANRLYVRLGFAPRETNVYRYSLEG